MGYAPPHHLLDGHRVDPGPLDELYLGGTEQFGGVQAGQTTVPLADRSAYRLDDHCLRHLVASLVFRLPTSPPV